MSWNQSLLSAWLAKTCISGPLTKALTNEWPAPNRATSSPVARSRTNKYMSLMQSPVFFLESSRKLSTKSPFPPKMTGVFSMAEPNDTGSLISGDFGFSAIAASASHKHPNKPQARTIERRTALRRMGFSLSWLRAMFFGNGQQSPPLLCCASRWVLQLLWRSQRGHLIEQLSRPKTQPLKTRGHGLLELNIRLHPALRRVAGHARLLAWREHGISGQNAVLQIN